MCSSDLINACAIFHTPGNLVQIFHRNMRNSFFQKTIYTLPGTYESRCINSIKVNVTVGHKKISGLQHPGFVQRRIKSASLNNVLTVWFCFSVANEVKFFQILWDVSQANLPLKIGLSISSPIFAAQYWKAYVNGNGLLSVFYRSFCRLIYCGQMA